MDNQPVMIIIYLIGVAGVGKSTTVKQLTNDWTLRMAATKPFAHRHYNTPYGRAVVIGKDTEPFGGTDTLSYTAINHMSDFMQTCAQHNVQLIIAEGDRLSNARFFTTAQQHATLLLFELQASDTVTEQRRTQRAQQHDKPLQNANWIAGRQTKVTTLAQTFNAIPIDATQPTNMITETIKQRLHLCLSKDHA